VEKLDVLDAPGLRALAGKYNGKPIDVVINNAGVLGDLPAQTLGTLDQQEFREVMAVNAFGPLAVSEAFRDNVARSQQKKIVAITSGAGIISGARISGGLYFYRASKVALNMVMRGLASDLAAHGIVVGIVAPGAVDTDMRRALVGAERAAKDLRIPDSVSGMIKVIDGLTLANSNQVYNYDGGTMPW
jgi:NAD(P)-dependent dehydrogenase (short-subunit alcohol dehydrogenase family)